jgi:hypothetical protein
MIARVRHRIGVDVPLETVFAAPVLSSLAERIIDLQLEAFQPSELQSMAATYMG